MMSLEQYMLLNGDCSFGESFYFHAETVNIPQRTRTFKFCMTKTGQVERIINL